MKKKNLFTLLAVAALTFGFTSCSNDDEATNPDGAAATLSINLDAPTMSRAVGTVPTDVVANYTVFITKSTGEIGWKEYSADASPLADIAVTTQADHVYVVANAGDLRNTITTLAALKEYKADLNGTGSQAAAANRWATGKTATALTFNASNKATADVTLKYIAARITVTVTNSMTNKTEPNAVTVNSLAVLNARGESLLFPITGESLVPASYSTGKAFYTGYNMPSGAGWDYWPTTAPTFAADVLANTPLVADGTTKYYYYVFENAATTSSQFPTVVTLVGKSGDGTKDLYWPVHLAAYEQFKDGSLTAGVTRGNSYDINITLTGDATGGGGGGTDPTNPIVNGSVTVTITVPTWNPVVLNKEF